MTEKKIHDYVVGDAITSYFAVRKKNVRDYYKGQFVSLELGNTSGRIDGVIWEPDQFALDELAEGMVVKVQAVVGEFRGKNQLAIGRIREAKEDEYTIEDILPYSTQSEDDRCARIFALTDKIENSYVKALAQSFWEDETFLAAYLKAAAGKLWHHATVGGLSEHSANVGELALRIASGYDFLDKDLLIFGGLFHDAGKIESYSLGTMIDFTDAGRLIDHISMADEWITTRARTIDSFPPRMLIKLRHMILSHHGEKAYGSPVVPQIPEAFVLYYCDEIDSKMGAIARIRDRQDGVGWSDWVNILSRHLYFGDKEE